MAEVPERSGTEYVGLAGVAMTSRDLTEIGLMVLGAAGELLVVGLVLPGDVGRALMNAAVLAFVAALALAGR